MLLEMHAHTARFSKCSIIDPVTLVKLVLKKGLQGVVLTEHHYQWNDEEIRQLRREAEVGDDFLILAGQEVETDRGHVLVYGADETIPKPLELRELRTRYPQAALVWAHPFRHGKLPDKKALLDPDFDGIEIFSLNQNAQENYRGLMQWHALKFTAQAGSDIHSEPMAGGFPTIFDHPVAAIQDVIAEIKNGRCRPFFKEIPKSGATIRVTEITIGTKGDDEFRQRIIVKQLADGKKWKKVREAVSLSEELYKRGFRDSTFRVPRIIEVNDKERILIEEGQRGKSLFDVLGRVNEDTGKTYFRLAAQWLAKLHDLKLRRGTLQELTAKERKRFGDYEAAFLQTGNPAATKAKAIIEHVRSREEELFLSDGGDFVQVHGDYHPKNIILGQDLVHDPATLFVSVIDFNNSLLFHPAFDVGYFLAQFEHQFGGSPDITRRFTGELFIESYLGRGAADALRFKGLVDLFMLRANLSIAAYLIKVGKGESAEMTGLLSRSLTLLEKQTR